MAIIYEIHHPKSGRAIGYLDDSDIETVTTLQRVGFIVIQETV